MINLKNTASTRVKNPFNKCIFLFVCMWMKGQTNQIFRSLKLEPFHKNLLYCLIVYSSLLFDAIVCVQRLFMLLYLQKAAADKWHTEPKWC